MYPGVRVLAVLGKIERDLQTGKTQHTLHNTDFMDEDFVDEMRHKIAPC